MLARTTHIVYIATVLALLVALLLRPAGHLTLESPENALNFTPTDTDADAEVASLALRGMAQLMDAANSREHATSGRQASSPSDAAATGPDQPLRPELMARAIAVACEIDPDRCAALRKLNQRNPAELQRRLQDEQIGRRLLGMVQLKDRDPQLYQAKLSEITHAVQVNKVAASLHEAVRKGDDAEAEQLRAQLRTVLQMQLLMSIKTRGEYLCRLEDEIQRLRAELEHEGANFHATIEARYQHLLAHEPSAGDESLLPAEDAAAAAVVPVKARNQNN